MNVLVFRRAVLLSLGVCFATSIEAADVQSFLAAKGQELRQTNSAPPVLIDGEPFRALATVSPSVPGAVTGASVRLPNSQVVTLDDVGDGTFEAEAKFTNKTQLDAQARQGIYNFTIQTLNDGTNRPALRLPADAYPTTPRALNWQDAQEVDVTFPFTLLWDSYTNGTTNDFIIFRVQDNLENDVFSTPGFLEPGVLNGTNTAATINADTLTANQVYEGRLLFVKRTDINTTNIPGATGLSGYYKETRFPLVTQPTPPPAGRIEFSQRNFPANESNSTAQITVTRSGSLGTVTVDFSTSNGSATDGLDYTGVNTTLTLEDGVTSTNVLLAVLDDFLLESNETVNLALANPTGGAVLGNRSNAVLTIIDNEIPSAGKLQFSSATYAAKEAGPIASVKVARVGGSVGAVSVQFATLGGGATDGLDYVGTNGTLFFASGQTTQTIPIRILEDSLDETNESFFVQLSSPTGGAALGSNTTATVTITDNDVAGLLAFSMAAFKTNENAAAAVITVKRTAGKAGGVTVDFATEPGTATPDADYYATNGTLTFASNELTKTFSIALTNDFVFEGDETINLRLTNATGGAKLGMISNAVLTIVDDESQIAFTNAGYTVTEAGPALKINLVRSGFKGTTVSVDFATFDGTAVSTNDYKGTNTIVTFPPNIAFKTISIPIVNDTIVEGDETFTAGISNPQGGTQLGPITNTTVTIADNDLGGVLSFSTTNYPAPETGPAVKITINRTGGAASGVTVDFTTGDGSATAGLDYSNATRTVTFNATEASKTIQVPIINDTLDETNETVVLTLSNPQGGASLGVRSNAMITITDNDVAGALSFSAASYRTNENAGAALISVTRTGGTASGVTVDFATEPDVATDPDDYSGTNGTLSFGANETSKTFQVPIVNDTAPEGDEPLKLHLSNPTGNATLGANSNAVLIIMDDESSVSLTNASYTVGETGPSVSITVLRSGALTTSVSVQLATADGSAVSTNDYRGTNVTLTFGANVAAQTVVIPIVNDTIDESNETFTVTLSNPLGGVQLGTLTNTTVTILDNDDAGSIQFSAAAFSGTEGSNAAVRVVRTGGLASGVTVQFTMSGGTATAGVDYTLINTNLSFGVGETNKTILIPILTDVTNEPIETVGLALSLPTGGAVLGATSAATLNISDRPDPNAIPANGPEFMTANVAGFPQLSVPAAFVVGTYNSVTHTFTVIGTVAGSSGQKTISIDALVVTAPGVVTLNSSGSTGTVAYTQILVSPPSADYVVSNQSGASGTVTIDVFDLANGIVTGRFTVTGIRQSTGLPDSMTGSFRAFIP